MNSERQRSSNSPEVVQNAASLPETSSSEKIITYRELLRMNGDELLEYICVDLAKAEEEVYGSSDAEAKLIFMGGTRKRDISKEKTFEGEFIYKNRPKFRKISESEEFFGVASQVIYEGANMEDAVSEAADLFYNLSRLSKLDTNGSHMHAPNYEYLMSQIATELGWDKRQALLVAAFKYHSRLVEKKEKDPMLEKELMERLLNGDPFIPDSEPQVHTPSFRQLDNACIILEHIKDNTLEPRLNQVRADKKLKSSGQISEPWS